MAKFMNEITKRNNLISIGKIDQKYDWNLNCNDIIEEIFQNVLYHVSLKLSILS